MSALQNEENWDFSNEIPNGIKAMLHEAQLVAEGKSEFQSYEDVFE